MADGQGITRGQIAGVTLGNALEFYDFLVFAFFAKQIGATFSRNRAPTRTCSPRWRPLAPDF